MTLDERLRTVDFEEIKRLTKGINKELSVLALQVALETGSMHILEVLCGLADFCYAMGREQGRKDRVMEFIVRDEENGQ